ncbi:MAG: alpha/beta fold hydrolase [Hyphomonadaceae bacterium]
MAVDLDFRVEGKGPPVALLHAVGLSHDYLAPIAARLSARHAVIRISARGHGASPDIERPLSMDDFAGDIAALLRRLSLGPAWIAGLSFGGMLAQLLALDHPDLVAGLALSGTAAGTPAAARAMLVDRGARALEVGMAALCEETLDRWFAPAYRTAPIAERARAALLAVKPRNWAETWRAMSEFDAAPRLKEIRAPALVLVGDHDVSAVPAMARALADSITGARYLELAGCGHMAPIENPDLFAASIGRFFAEYA